MADCVQLFHTCLVNEFDLAAGLAVVRVLERVGCEVEVPADQTCCGQSAYNAGFHDEARQIARYTVDVLSRSEGPIVIPSGSCADMIVHHYAHLFESDAPMLERVRAVASRCEAIESSNRAIPRFCADHLCPRSKRSVSISAESAAGCCRRLG